MNKILIGLLCCILVLIVIIGYFVFNSPDSSNVNLNLDGKTEEIKPGISVIENGDTNLKLKTLVSSPYLLAEKQKKIYVKVGLTGWNNKETEDRIPINCAIVIDKSGSMSGQKIWQAKNAAVLALDLMNNEDIVSVVVYDTEVNVILPATKLTNKKGIINKIQQINAGGSTAIYGGVRKGEDEIKKFISDNKVNRVVLLSDGLANVGPSYPEDFAELGSVLIKDGISVTTIGLGLDYNEDLLHKLADKSNGNHYFVQEPADLVKIFEKEFKTIFNVVIQEVSITIDCAPGVKPIRIMGRDANITGQHIETYINQLYQEQEKYLLFEATINPGKTTGDIDIASINISCRNAKEQLVINVERKISAKCTDSKKLVDQNEDREVFVDVILQIATDKNIEAMKVRDSGDIETAKELLIENANYLQTQGDKYSSDILREYAKKNLDDSENLSEESWNEQRKMMNEQQHSNANQQY